MGTRYNGERAGIVIVVSLHEQTNKQTNKQTKSVHVLLLLLLLQLKINNRSRALIDLLVLVDEYSIKAGKNPTTLTSRAAYLVNEGVQLLISS